MNEVATREEIERKIAEWVTKATKDLKTGITLCGLIAPYVTLGMAILLFMQIVSVQTFLIVLAICVTCMAAAAREILGA